MATIFAGPGANYLLAVAGFFLLAVGPGMGRPFASAVLHGSPAARAGMLSGDVLLSIDGRPARTNEDVVAAIQAAAGKPVHVTVRRTEPVWDPIFRAHGLPLPDWPDLIGTDVSSVRTFTVTPRQGADPMWMMWWIAAVPEPQATADAAMMKWLRPDAPVVSSPSITPAQEEALLAQIDRYRTRGEGPYRIGVAIGAADWDRQHLPIGAAATVAVTAPVNVSKEILDSLGQLFTGQASTKDLSGPVGITRVIKDQFDQGWGAALSTLALLNVYLGLFNLLPWPALDGGRLVFLLYEAASRRRANARVEQAVHAVGFALLLAMLVLVTAKDIMHLGG